jgi:chromosome segregation ATPase
MNFDEWLDINNFKDYEYLDWGRFVWDSAIQKGGCARDQKTTQYCAQVVDCKNQMEILELEIQRLTNQVEDRDYKIFSLDQDLQEKEAELWLLRADLDNLKNELKC